MLRQGPVRLLRDLREHHRPYMDIPVQAWIYPYMDIPVHAWIYPPWIYPRMSIYP